MLLISLLRSFLIIALEHIYIDIELGAKIETEIYSWKYDVVFATREEVSNRQHRVCADNCLFTET